MAHRLETKQFADRLKEERTKRNLTQQELAALCNLIGNQISRYESSSREPSIKALTKLASALEISSDYLIGLTDDRNERIISTDLGPHERQILDIFHEQGWSGIIKLGAERLGNR